MRELTTRFAHIKEVDMTKRRIIVEDEYGTTLYVSLHVSDTVIAVPKTGEIWTVKRRGNDWLLDRRLEGSQHQAAFDELQPGDRLITGDNVRLEGTLTGDDISLDGTLTWGGDVALYRGAADVLETTDSIRINGANGFSAIGGSSGRTIFSSSSTGDTQNRISIDGNGRISWGTGTTAPDVFLYRGGSDHLKSDDYLVVGGTSPLALGDVGNTLRFTRSDATRAHLLTDGNAYGTLRLGSVQLQDDTIIARESAGVVRVTNSIYSEPWIAPTLTAGWANYGGGYNTAGYYKDVNNRVWLKGLFQNTSGAEKPSSSVLFQLPVGYRPSGVPIFASTSINGHARIDVITDGNVLVQQAIAAGGWISIDNLSFRV